jgi:hypothetical protein
MTRYIGAGILALAIATPAAAASFTLTPSSPDVFDLDHHKAYTWRMSGVALPPGEKITGATLVFDDIRNWDSNPNMLFVHLLDTAKWSGLRQFTDDPTGSAPVLDITDDFVATRYHGLATWLVAPGTARTSLFSRSFGTSAEDFTYTFTKPQLAALSGYLADGTLAIGFDPDCHFFNNGIKLSLITRPATVPEPATIGLLGLGLAAVARRMRRQRVP